jgi:DNA-binding HxlR family transcriptional regulator/putative sterol carrier protein
MPATKPYDQYCAIARALEVVGDRWTLLLVRELLTGPKRHTDLRAGLPGIATNVLGDRLQLLQQAGLVRRAILPPPAASTVYELTDRGRQLKPVLLALAGWGLPLLDSPRDQDTFRLSWLVLALEQRFDPQAARGVELTWELRVDDEVLHVIIDNDTVQTLQGPAPAPDVVLEADRDLFLAWATGQLPDNQALAAGLRVTPGRQALQQLRQLFPNRLLPEAEG